jgi:BMFP domain-containing protein YqiC
MVKQELLDELSAKIKEAVANSPVRDIEKNLRAMLAAAFARLDLVTREEFDVQSEVLARTRAKLDQLEAKLAELEKSVTSER